MNTMSEWLQSFAICFLIITILYIIFAPWLSIIDIGKNCENIADEIRYLRKELEKIRNEMDRYYERKNK